MEPAAVTEVKPKERKKIHFGVPDSESADLEGDGEARERKKIHFGVPDSESTDLEGDGEARERKKIHFAVPTTAPSNLDPRQVEMIRRRRPTPATLFRVADQTSPEDDQSTHQWVVGENGVLKPKRVNPNVYQPPSLKAVQKMAEAQMLHLGIYPPMEDPYEGEEYEDYPHGDEDQQDTTNNFDKAGKASREIESAKQTQVEEEEEEGIAEGNMDVKTEEKTQGSD